MSLLSVIASRHRVVGGSTIWRDDFTTTGTTFVGRTPDSVNNGNLWQVAAADFSVGGAGGNAMCNTSAPRAWIESSNPNVIITSEIVAIAALNRRIGILFRYVDDSNYWRLVARFDATIGWELVRRVAGADTTIASGNNGRVNGAGMLEVRTLGSSIQCYSLGSLVDSRTDATFSTATKHGMVGTNSNTVATMINFIEVHTNP